MDPGKHEVTIPVKTKLFVYISHCFTTMGARMWWFGVGLFLVEVTPHSLQLTALYGFSNGGAMLLLAAVIGDWIDRSNRLKAARVALVLNNVSITVCCVVIFLVLTYRSQIEAVWDDTRLLTVCFAIVVIITIFANLTNLGRVLIMERDWIVEICQRDTATIATMSATFRFIDLCTKVVAPLVTGQIMTYGSHIYGAIFIAGWNIAALFVEYFLVWKIYTLVPALHSKSTKDTPEIKEKSKMATQYDKEYRTLPLEDVHTLSKETTIISPRVQIHNLTPDSDLGQRSHQDNEKRSGINVNKIVVNTLHTGDAELAQNQSDKEKISSPSDHKSDDYNSAVPDEVDLKLSKTAENIEIGTSRKDPVDNSHLSEKNILKKDLESGGYPPEVVTETNSAPSTKEAEKPKSLAAQLSYSLISLYRGWRTYMKYDVAIAGWSLAFLYFTVLGFDNITIGYATTQGMSESLVGILIGCAAVSGIIASVSFPFLRKKFGLVRTGTIGLSWEVACLVLCIVSLWMPGGTFDPNRDWSTGDDVINRNCSSTVATPSRTSSGLMAEPYINTTSEPVPIPEIEFSTACNYQSETKDRIPESKASIIMLLMGIVGARFGVWLTDLAITQLFLEAVSETERGIVNGFQSSLNKLMDMLKFSMIIFIPDPSMFGYPAVVSFCFIFSSWLLYTRFSKKRTGHLLFGKSHNYILDTK
ncbi:ferroportin-like [Argopecten irradians]|uniref:ferroportin-like n=1 Tax=Argopecten irradians TaxID=31199 RepID=UPI00371C7FBD